MAAVALLEGTRSERGPGQGPRRRLRPLAAWEFPGRPHRSALVAYLDAEQAHLRLTQGQMADLLGVGRRTYVRFHSGAGKLGKQMRLSLLARYPRWKRTIDGVADEDRHLEELLALGR